MAKKRADEITTRSQRPENCAIGIIGVKHRRQFNAGVWRRRSVWAITKTGVNCRAGEDRARFSLSPAERSISACSSHDCLVTCEIGIIYEYGRAGEMRSR